MLEKRNLTKEIKEKEGDIIYLYNSGHVRRAVGSVQTIDWQAGSPYYYLDEKGKLKRSQSFEIGRPVVTFIYKLISASRILKLLKRNIPTINDQHVTLSCELINGMKNRILSFFPKSQFITAIHESNLDPENDQKLEKCLNNKKIKIIKVNNSPKLAHDKIINLQLEDGHLNPLGNAVLAKNISQELQYFHNAQVKKN